MNSFDTTIGEIGEIFDGPHATPKKTVEGPYFLSISSLENGRFDLSKSAHLSKEDFKKWTRRVIPKAGDLLFSYETRLGEAALVPEGIQACLGRRMGLLRPNREKVLPGYLLYSYLSPAFQQTIISNTIRGATVDRIAIAAIANFPLQIPSLGHQATVVRILKSIDDKIKLNNRINEELEAMAKLIYEYWFVQFDFPVVTSSGVQKPYKSSGGKMVWNKELKREIPEGWERGDLKDLADFNPSLKIERNSEAPYLGMTSISTTGYMTEMPEKKEFSGGIKFQNGDILVARITPCLENGKTALITMLAEGSIGFGSTEFINIRAKKKSYVSFLAILSRSDSFRHYAISKMTGTSGRKRVDANELAKFQLPVPPDDLLKNYGDLIDPYFQKMTSNSNQNHELATLRDWLLPMLMNGQVTVADAEELVDEKLGMVAEERYNTNK